MNDTVPLHPSERIDQLPNNQLKIIQSREVFSYSTDAVLLAHFANVPRQGKIIDLCTGNGIIPLLLSTKTKGKIIGVEIQERLSDMAKRSVILNQLHDRVEIIHGDLKEMPEHFGDGCFDYLTCNPPYLAGGGDKNLNPHYAIARHEILCTLEDVVRVSSRLVRSGGKTAFIHRPARLVELFTIMREYRIEPKRVCFVHPRIGQEANMVLVEGVRDGGKELKVLPPLIVYQETGVYTKEIQQIYEGFHE